MCTSITAPDTWTLKADPTLASTLAGQPSLLSSLNAVLPSLGVPQISNPPMVWVRSVGPEPVSYLAGGDAVYGVSAVSQAQTASDERSGVPVPLAYLEDTVSHTAAPGITTSELAGVWPVILCIEGKAACTSFL